MLQWEHWTVASQQDGASRRPDSAKLYARRAAELQESLDRRARFTPEMRFTLEDEEAREFGAERWCYRGRIDGWLELPESGSIKKLARKW